MYLRHFAFTRLPFETPAETDELFESNARREAEATFVWLASSMWRPKLPMRLLLPNAAWSATSTCC